MNCPITLMKIHPLFSTKIKVSGTTKVHGSWKSFLIMRNSLLYTINIYLQIPPYLQEKEIFPFLMCMAKRLTILFPIMPVLDLIFLSMIARQKEISKKFTPLIYGKSLPVLPFHFWEIQRHQTLISLLMQQEKNCIKNLFINII